MTNSDLFGVFATQTLATLYENFPISMRIPRDKMVALISAQEDMWVARREMSTIDGMEMLLKEADLLSSEIAAKYQAKRVVIEAKTAEHQASFETVAAVYDGTISFLEVEGFIREESPGVYQLTLKGLAHLNKRFDQCDISNSVTLFQKLHAALQPDKFFGSVTSGALVGLAGKVLGS